MLGLEKIRRKLQPIFAETGLSYRLGGLYGRALWISWGAQRKPRKTSRDRGDRDIMGIVCKKLPNYKTKPCIGRKGYNGKIMMEFDNS